MSRTTDFASPSQSVDEAQASVRQRRRARRAGVHRHALPVCPVTGKLRYRSEDQATDALTAASWQRNAARVLGLASSRRECRYYDCAHCLGLHLTSWLDYRVSRSMRMDADASTWMNSLGAYGTLGASK